MNVTDPRGSRSRRTVDIAVAVVGGLILVPLVALTAMTVLVGLGRPVLFRQERPGLHGEPFTMLKFRTMRPLRVEGESDGERTSRLGYRLRAISLDELPQLWNVLRGDMSIIGPRPTLPEQVARYNDRERGRLAVRPGVTGWAQVNGRNAISWEARIDLDLWYIANRTPVLDLKIIWMTLLRVLRPQGVLGEGGINPDFVGTPLPVDPTAAPDDGGATTPWPGAVPAPRPGAVKPEGGAVRPRASRRGGRP